MLELRGYFDESGTHDTSNAVAVAGYISTPEQWEIFTTEWTSALRDWGLEYFHMTDFANRANEYRCWSDQDRRFRFARLLSIINRHALASIATVIPAKSYDVIFTKQARRFTGGPYGVAAACCFMEAARVLQPLYPSAGISYVFEKGAVGMGEGGTCQRF